MTLRGEARVFRAVVLRADQGGKLRPFVPIAEARQARVLPPQHRLFELRVVNDAPDRLRYRFRGRIG